MKELKGILYPGWLYNWMNFNLYCSKVLSWEAYQETLEIGLWRGWPACLNDEILAEVE